jgi:sugar O-acyltransferase (sialic acid O-acetyltransferase NeuD family)
MNDARKIVIVGAGESAEIAYEYFTHDSPHEVVAFAVEAKYREADELFGVPVIDFEQITGAYPPDRFGAFVALSSTFLNRARRKLYLATQEKGYRCVSYVSSKAFVWRNVKIGENTMIFENNVLQYHVSVGDDTVLWSGNHVGHRTTIGSHVFIASHAVISGFCNIGDGCFLGVNCCLGDEVSIGEDCVIGMGAVVVKSLKEPGRVYVGNPAKALDKSAYDAFEVPPELR